MASSSQHKFRRVHLLSSAFASLTIAAPPAYAADDPVEAGGDEEACHEEGQFR